MKPLLALFGAVQVVLGLLLWITPGFFFDEIGPYGVRNDHYLGDLATWYLALGAVTLVAVRACAGGCRCWPGARPEHAARLQPPDRRDHAHPKWLGPANLISLVLTSVLLAWMLNAQRQPAR